MQPCIFLDRDGTLIDEVSYLSDWSQIRIFNDVPLSLARLHKAGYLLIVITNQSGIARGYFTTDFVEKTFLKLNTLLAEYHVKLDDQFYCPHHPEQGIPPYKRVCTCRKPKTGMIDEACKKYSFDLRNSYMLGDKLCDMQLAVNAGVQGLLLKTGHGAEEVDKVNSVLPDIPNFNNFSSATDYILSKKGKD